MGASFFLRGQWAAATDPLERASRRFRDESVGRWHERGTADFWRLMALDFQGAFRELVVAGDRYLRDAEDRGNLYMATDLRTRIVYLTALLRDDPETAQRTLDDALAAWPTEGWSLQHCRWTESSLNVALYRGEIEYARKVVADQWPGFRQSFVRRVRLMRGLLETLEARVCLLEATSSRSPGDRSALAKRVRAVGRRMDQWNDPVLSGWARLLQAGAARVRGDEDEALRGLVLAEECLAASKMAGYVAVARRRRGELLGGDEGRDLITAANAWLEQQGVKNAAAWARMYAPGFED